MDVCMDACMHVCICMYKLTIGVCRNMLQPDKTLQHMQTTDGL
jgi:hypothetical protein